MASEAITLSAPDLVPTVFQVLGQRTPCPGPLPASAHPYGNMLDLSWTNRCPGARVIEITFDARTRLEWMFDYLHVTDASGANVADSPFTGDSLANRTLIMPGDTVILRLETDDAISDWGFAVSAIAALEPDPSPSVTVRHDVALFWEVRNGGTDGANAQWYDNVYLSTTPSASNAFAIAYGVGAPFLQPNGSYSRSVTARTLGYLPGDYYLILQADVVDDLTEANESNNDLVLPVRLEPVNLAVTALSAPTSAAPQQHIWVTWIVTNVGPHTPMPYWASYLYLRQGVRSNIVDITWNYTPLPSSAAYTVTQELIMPSIPPGTYQLEIHVEGGGENSVAATAIDVIAPDLVALSASAPPAADAGEWFSATFVVSNAGPVNAYYPWSDVVYVSRTNYLTSDSVGVGNSLHYDLAPGMVETQQLTVSIPATHTGDLFLLFQADGFTDLFDPNIVNNFIALSLRVEAADLVPTSFHVTNSPAAPNQPINLSWTVKNQGTATANNYWIDSIFLATDSAGTNAIAGLNSYWYEDGLIPGASYNRAETVRCPAAPPGNYFLLIKTDGVDYWSEGNESNNTLAVPLTILGADLTAESIIAPASGAPQQPFQVSWTVRNLGPATAYPPWHYTVYIARTNSLPQILNYVTSGSSSVSTAAGESYTQTQSVAMPSWIDAGDYALVLDTEYEVYPLDTNTNNRTWVPIRIQGPDLVALALSAPASALLQSNARVSLLISNAGPVTAYPPWYHYFYVAPTNNFEQGAALVGTGLSSTPLPPGSTTIIPVELRFLHDAAGPLYLVAQVDTGTLSDPDPSNNQIAVPITIHGADLVPEWSMPSTGIVVAAQQPLELQWIVRNIGDAPTLENWVDLVEIKSTRGFSRLRHILTLACPGRLDPGESYLQSATASLSSMRPGHHNLLLQVDPDVAVYEGSETNNEVSLPITIVSPDLVLVDLLGPSVVDGQSTIELLWRVQNLGPVQAFPSWHDRVYVSTTSRITPDAVPIWWESRYESLAIDQTYSVTQFVTLPPLSSTNYYLIVKTDAETNLFDTFLDNNELAIPLTIKHPDLVPRRFSAFQWGPACPGPYPESPHPYPANADLWWTNTCPGAIGLRVTFSHTTDLGSGDQLHVLDDRGYDAAGSPLQGPAGVAGATRYVVGDTAIFRLRTDAAEEGYGFTVDSISPILEDALPDLAPQSEIPLLYIVENLGPGRAMYGWYDQIYLSGDAALNLDEIALHEEFFHYTPLNVGARYLGFANMFVPGAPAGDYFLIFRANGAYLAEHDFSNNTLTLPVRMAAVDLQFLSLTATNEAAPRQRISISWSVRNNGPAPAFPRWYDSFYLSTNPVWTADAVSIESFWRTQGVGAGDSYADSGDIFIPNVAPGDYYLIGRTDAEDDLGDAQPGNNSRAIPIRIFLSDLVAVSLTGFRTIESCPGPYPSAESVPRNTVLRWTNSCPGAGMLQVSFDDDTYVDYGRSYIAVMDENGTHVSGSPLTGLIGPARRRIPGDTVIIELSTGLSVYDHFRITDISSIVETNNLVTAPQGELDVRWRVENRGLGAATAQWYDQFHLSPEPYPYAGSFVGSFQVATDLIPGAEYLEETTLHLQFIPPGEYQLLLQVDGYNHHPESSETNNVFAIPITVSDPPDLRPIAFTAPTLIETSHRSPMIDVSWTVTNQGVAVTPGYWYDAVYLSRDAEYDLDDIQIASIGRFGSLGPAQTYSATQTVTLQLTDPGQYHLLLWIDAPVLCHPSCVYELDETNNIIPIPIHVTLTLPDLVLADLIVPPLVVSSRDYPPVDVRWVVRNDGQGAAIPPWRDGWYVNGEYQYSMYQNAPLLPGASYTNGTLSPLSLTTNGTYTVTVRADDSAPFNTLLETVETNNSRTVSFQFVRSPKELVPAGDLGSVPLSFGSSVPASVVELDVFVPPEKVPDLSAGFGAPELWYWSTIPMGQGRYHIRFETSPGQSLVGTQSISQIHFQTSPNQSSSFVPLSISNLVARTPQGAVISNVFARAPRAVIIGPEPLLEAASHSIGQHLLTIYGLPGSNVTVETQLSLNPSGWGQLWQGTLSNRFQQLGPFQVQGTSRFYRARY